MSDESKPEPTPVIDKGHTGFFLEWDNSEPPQLWVWRGEPGDEAAEPWQRVVSDGRFRVVNNQQNKGDLMTISELLALLLPNESIEFKDDHDGWRAITITVRSFRGVTPCAIQVRIAKEPIECALFDAVAVEIKEMLRKLRSEVSLNGEHGAR